MLYYLLPEEKLESNLSKLVVIIWVFAVLILTTSYTASLTSMLTVRKLQPTINLLREGDYVGYQEGSFLASCLKEMGFDEAKLRGYATMDQYADALKMGSENGGVSAIVDEVPYLKLFLSRYCEGYSMAGPTYKSGGFGFVRPLAFFHRFHSTPDRMYTCNATRMFVCHGFRSSRWDLLWCWTCRGPSWS